MKKWAACFVALSLVLCLPAVGVAADEITTTTETTTTTAEVTTTTTVEATTTEAATTTTVATTTTTQSVPQTLAVELEISAQENGRFSIVATDEIGRPVAGYPLHIQVGSTVSRVETNANGVYSSIGWTANKQLTYRGEGCVVGNTTYLPVAQVTVAHPNAVPTGTAATTTVKTTVSESTTTATQADATTTVEVTPTTADTALPVGGSTATGIIIGDRTTSYRGDAVVTNVVTDSTILSLFGCDQNTFLNSASFELDKNTYTAIVGTYSNHSVLLNVGAATELPSETMLNAALKGSDEFADYSSNERKAMTFRLSLLVLDSTGAIVPQDALHAGLQQCVVKLPVPDSMKDADKLAITIPSGNGLQTPVTVEPHDGCIWLRVDSLPENYTLIEFTEEAVGSDIISLILYIAGVLLLVGAGLLLFFFVFRKPKPVAAVNEDEIDVPEIAVLPENDGDDIFSGRTDLSSYDISPAPEILPEEPPAPPSDTE